MEQQGAAIFPAATCANRNQSDAESKDDKSGR